MAKSVVSLQTDKFLSGLSETGREYHRSIMYSLAAVMDDIRFEAAKNIIPRKIATRSKSRRALIRLWILQPPTPGRLTERTGKLKSVLQSGGRNINANWKIPRTLRQARLQNVSQHLLFKIIPQKNDKLFWYEATGKLRPKGEDKAMKQKINEELRKGRKFWEPAVRKMTKNISGKMFKALSKEWNKVL